MDWVIYLTNAIILCLVLVWYFISCKNKEMEILKEHYDKQHIAFDNMVIEQKKETERLYKMIVDEVKKS